MSNHVPLSSRTICPLVLDRMTNATLARTNITLPLLYVVLMQGVAWLTGVGCAAWLFVVDMRAFRLSHGLSINGNALIGRDFANIWSAGQLVIEDKLSILYSPLAYQAWQTGHFGGGIRDHNYSYPPLTLLYTPIFGALPYVWAFALWTIASVGLFTLAARPWLQRAGYAPALAVLFPSTMVCDWAGHYGLIIGALTLGAWHQLRTRPKMAGILTGLMVIKPHLAILMPLMLLRRRAWSALAAAAVTVAVLIALSLLIFGPALWQTWLGQTTGEQLRMASATHSFFIKMMPTSTPALFHWGLAANLVWPIQILIAVATGGLLWRFHPEDPHQAALATATGTFLVLPYAFNYDMTVVGLAGALIMHRKDARDHLWRTAAGAIGFVLPAAVIFLNRQGWWIAPLLLLALLLATLEWRRPMKTGFQHSPHD